MARIASEIAIETGIGIGTGIGVGTGMTGAAAGGAGGMMNLITGMTGSDHGDKHVQLLLVNIWCVASGVVANTFVMAFWLRVPALTEPAQLDVLLI
jgi:hypothetical protein